MPPPDGSQAGPSDFFRTITAAVREFAENGYVSQVQLEDWLDRIRAAALRSLVPLHVVEKEINRALTFLYEKEVARGLMLKRHAGVSGFTFQQVKPKLHAELGRRVMVSADLVKLNRTRAVETTVQRFAGWAGAQRPGGSRATDKVETKQGIRKALSQLPFEERRVAIDQGHKFLGALDEILAQDAGALAFRWKSNWRQRGYDYREQHKERDGHVYAMRGNWALNRGLMRPGPDGYSDEISAPGQEVFCRCTAHYLYSLDRLPGDMLTEKGRAELARARAAA